MKWLVISIILLVCAYLVWPRRQAKVRGRFSDLPGYLGGLMAANNPNAFLIVDFPGSSHFVQFSGGKTRITARWRFMATGDRVQPSRSLTSTKLICMYARSVLR
jgi:hypothetical protein